MSEIPLLDYQDVPDVQRELFGAYHCEHTYFLTQFLKKDGCNPSYPYETGTLLHSAATDDEKLDFAKELIKHGADINAKGPMSDAPIHVAAVNDNLPLLKLLLHQYNGWFQSRLDHGVFRDCSQHEKLHNLDIDAHDKVCNTALYYALKYRNQEFAAELLKHGAFIGKSNTVNESPLKYMMPSTLQNLLDSCVTCSQDTKKKLYYLNYNFLKPRITCSHCKNIPRRESDPLYYMSRRKHLKHLLKHPLLSTFIYVKWQKFRFLFYINLILHFLFCVFLTVFALIQPRETSVSNFKKPEVEEKQTIHPVKTVVIILTLLLTIQELFKLILRLLNYIFSFGNWLKIITLIVTMTLVVFDCQNVNNESVCSQMFAVAIMSSWLFLFLVLGKHPFLSLNIEMFKIVSVSFLQLLASYALLILAFALSFYILFRRCVDDKCPDFFSEISGSIFKSFLMLTGEFESGSIPFDSGVSQFIFASFVFLCAIVLFNLLNGLAVSDTKAIRDNAKLHSNICRLSVIHEIELILLGNESLFKKLQTFCFCLPRKFSGIDNYLSTKLNLVDCNTRDSIVEVDLRDRKGTGWFMQDFRIDEDTCNEFADILSKRKETNDLLFVKNKIESIEQFMENTQNVLLSQKERFDSIKSVIGKSRWFLERNEKLLLEIRSSLKVNTDTKLRQKRRSSVS